MWTNQKHLNEIQKLKEAVRGECSMKGEMAMQMVAEALAEATGPPVAVVAGLLDCIIIST